HYDRRNCACRPCKDDRAKGCKQPNKCTRTARTIVTSLTPKYNPLTTTNKDDLTLTHRRREKNAYAIAHRRGDITFDPTMTAKSSLTECFRIFADPTKLTQQPALRLQAPPHPRTRTTTPVTVYTDGSCLNNGKLDAACGSGIWVSEDSPLNRAARTPGTTQSNQAGELAAVLLTLQTVNPFTPITLITD
ncbi:hypothetical protein BV22DRAFT_995068, partial [Leucogyrophana mollusca]